MPTGRGGLRARRSRPSPDPAHSPRCRQEDPWWALGGCDVTWATALTLCRGAPAKDDMDPDQAAVPSLGEGLEQGTSYLRPYCVLGSM